MFDKEIESSQLFARLRPHDPRGGQPHKKIAIAPLNMTFRAGKFLALPPKIATRFKAYLEQQYPEQDSSRPCAYQIVTSEEMRRIVKKEHDELQLKQRAAAMGMSIDEMRRIERQSKAYDGNYDFDRADRIRNRPKTELELMAEEIKEAEKPTSIVSEIEQEQKAEEAELQKNITKQSSKEEKNANAAAITSSFAGKTEIEGYDEEDMWSEMQGELDSLEPEETQPESQTG